MTTNRTKAVSLIELLVVIAIIAILAAVIYPSYQDIRLESNRTDAHASLIDAKGIVEDYLFKNNTTDWTGATIPATSGQDHYNLALVNDGSGGYQINATAVGFQANDTACPVISLDWQDNRSPAACW